MIGAIEQGVIDRVLAASRLGVLGYAYRQVESMPVDFDEARLAEVQAWPAAWTVFGGLRALDALGGGPVKVEATFHLIVGAENLRSERATRHGGGSDREVGAYQLAEDAMALLMGQDLDLPIGGLALVSCTSLYTGALRGKRQISLYALAFTTAFTFDPLDASFAEGAQAVGDFAAFAADWDTGAGHATDAADHVTLSQSEAPQP